MYTPGGVQDHQSIYNTPGSQYNIDEGFVHPSYATLDRRNNTGGAGGMRSKFFAMNDIKYTPIQESQGQMIRCIPDGSQPA